MCMSITEWKVDGLRSYVKGKKTAVQYAQDLASASYSAMLNIAGISSALKSVPRNSENAGITLYAIISNHKELQRVIRKFEILRISGIPHEIEECSPDQGLSNAI